MSTRATATIARKRRAARGGVADSALSFESLRTEGLRLAQTLSGHAWTDYNLHDPGVTMLEQLCYALTDLVYRTDFPVADHLRAPRSSGIRYPELSLHPPQDVFPCRATSAADYRRVLLDQVPGLDDATLAVGPPRDAGGVSLGEMRGLYRLQLKMAQGVMTGADTRVADARTAYRKRRTLCEDIDARVSLMEDVLCNLRVDAELAGPRDPVDVLADIYARCARHLAQGLSFQGLDELLARGLSLEQIYTGPVTEQGFAPEADEPAPELLFISDLTAIVKSIDGVQEVRSLSLLRDGDGQHSSAMRWRGDTWALRLRVPGLADARAPEAVQALLRQHVTLRRRGAVLSVSPVELSHRLADLYAASRTRRRAAASTGTVALPQGQYRDLQHYASVQHGFPHVYGLGRHGLPSSASAQEKAQVLQLKSYLALFEQVIAHGTAQVEHLRDLYSGVAPRGPSYWWQMLDDSIVPGLDPVYRAPDDSPPLSSPDEVRGAVQAEVYESRDPRTERRSRALDHLLALHGTTFTQNSMRQFCDYLSPAELELALLDNKAAFLQDIVALNRDRAAGLDYATRSWGELGSGTGLQRRVSHLLGFRHVHSRPLLQPFRHQNRSLDGGGSGARTRMGTTRPLRPHLQTPSRDDMLADLTAMPVLRSKLLSAAVLRSGLYRERYRVVGEPLDQAGARAASGPQELVLGPDEAGRWWPLGEFTTPEAAARAADSLRRFLMHLSFESEGLHVVEHVLLRPIGNSAAHARLQGLPADFYALRLSAVFPTWTARCAQPNFQRLADETVQLNCPAHVAARCLWLDHEAMGTFEEAYAEWLDAKFEFCEATASALDEAAADPLAAARVNEAACLVIECLLPVWERSAEAARA